MTYKTFTGETLSEALNRARYEYGDWVQLIDQKKKYEKKGLFGIFGKKEYVEIMVDVERHERAKKQPAPRTDMGQLEALEKIKQVLEARKAQAPAPAVQPVQQYGDVASEIKDLKEALGRMLEEKKSPGISNSGFDRIRTFLEDNDFEKAFSDRIIDTLTTTLTVKDISDSNKVRSTLESLLEDQIAVAEPLNAASSTPRVLALVGPTGVGKTTTIAKIGAGLTYHEKSKVTLLSMDNYRIGGQDQLAQYARIMDLPFHVVHHQKDFERIIEDADDNIFILDTAGRNQKKELEVNEIRHFLQNINIALDVYLTVSATTKYRDLVEIMEKFQVMQYTRVILTKADETNSYGPVISALAEKNKQLAYICTGQDVPDDIKIAEKRDFIAKIMMRYPLYCEESCTVG